MSIVVFLGPSLPRAEASRLLEAEYRPPAEQGSVYGAATALNPEVIVLIDGAFASAPAVRHMEILYALSRGIRVLGASSLGAIRASELWQFGMQGHGLIYRWYRSTPFLDDDEIAVTMTPASLGSEPLSEALVNIRLTIRAAEHRGLITSPARRSLEAIAQATYFTERNYESLMEAARNVLDRPILARLQEWIRENAVDQKRTDAQSLLGRLARGDLGAAPPVRPFTLTDAFLADLEVSGCDPEPALLASGLTIQDDSMQSPWQS